MKKMILPISIIVMSIILGITLGLVLNSIFGNNGENARLALVPIAKVDLASGETIEESNLDFIVVPEEDLNENVITDYLEIIGMLVADNTTIPAGSYFYAEKMSDTTILDPGEVLASYYYLYPFETEDFYIYSIGDYITLNLSGELSGEFIDNVRVFSMDTNYLYLEVTEEMFRYLNIIEQLGTITITPSHMDYVEESSGAPVFVNESFNAYLDSRSLSL